MLASQRLDLARATIARSEASPRFELADATLERPTRRFAIDPILKLLGWDPDQPEITVEEARSNSAEDGKPLFFDYLGRDTRDRSPVLIVEAKRFDVPLPRVATGANDLARRIISCLSKSGQDAELPKQWRTWLENLATYVRSLDTLARRTLQRVVITSGQWMVVFSSPIRTLLENIVSGDDIHCFASRSDLIARARELFDLLDRRRLVDTIPFTLSLDEAIRFLPPPEVAGFFRAVMFTTRTAGHARSEYPTRTVSPALIVSVGNRQFAIVDFNDHASEPTSALFSNFRQGLAFRAAAFEQKVLRALCRTDLTPSPLTKLPRIATRSEERPLYTRPQPGSTTAQMERIRRPERPLLVRDADGPNSYVVITGTDWHFKLGAPRAECSRHQGSGRGPLLSIPTLQSLTVNGDEHHCADDELPGHKSSTCFVAQLETHLCCRACLFHAECWGSEETPPQLRVTRNPMRNWPVSESHGHH